MKTAAHTASAAALAIFGLLIFIDPLFALLAIASYVLPPVVLFAVSGMPSADANDEGAWKDRDRPSEDVPDPDQSSTRQAEGTDRLTASEGTASGGDSVEDGSPPETVPRDDDSDTDSDDGGTDTDLDSDGGDTDTDSDA